MNRIFYTNVFGWGFLLWLIGYILGIVFFATIPASMIGWYIMPIGIVITTWVAMKKIHGKKFQDYIDVAVIWTVTAIVADYLFLVLVFNPADGYYKFDVYLYYIITFAIPIVAGSLSKNRS